MNKETLISICANCQAEFLDVDREIKKAERERKDIVFSHGICPRHFSILMKDLGKTDKEIDARIKKGGFQCQDLKQNPELVKMYSKGIFIPQDQLKEMFKKRAGII